MCCISRVQKANLHHQSYQQLHNPARIHLDAARIPISIPTESWSCLRSGAASCIQRYPVGRYIAASGGDGAPGGNVVLVASAHLNELRGVPRHAKAGRGGPGGKNGRTGAVGKDVVVRVPVSS